MTIAGIDHVQLAMPNGREEEARKSYFGFLGIPERIKLRELAKRGGVWFEGDAVEIHLGAHHYLPPFYLRGFSVNGTSMDFGESR